MEEHPVSFQFGHQFHFSVLLQRLGELEKDEFSLFFVGNGATTEVNISFYLVSIFEELHCVLHFKIEVVLVGLRAEADLFDHLLALLGLEFLVFFLLFVKEFLVIDNSADRRIGSRYNFHQVQPNFLGDLQCLFKGIDFRGDVVADETNLESTDKIIDLMLRLPLDRGASAIEGSSPATTRRPVKT